MGQEFTIKSEAIESKINQLLPTQGGFAPGVDISASSMVVPIVDLTETAEGSNVRQDLQTAFGFSNVTSGTIQNTTSVIINTTGYYRVFGSMFQTSFGVSSAQSCFLFLSDGSVDKTLFLTRIGGNSSYNDSKIIPFDFNVFIKAGETLEGTSTALNNIIFHTTRQIADLDGNLVDP